MYSFSAHNTRFTAEFTSS